MIIRFKHEFSLPVEEVFSYFQTPADWARLYGLAGDVTDLGGGCSRDSGAARERSDSRKVPMGLSLKATRKSQFAGFSFSLR